MSAALIHPAARRRIARVTPPPASHEVALRPFGGAGAAGMIVTASEAGFIEAVLDDATRPDAAARLVARRGRRRGADRVLELHQPVHRRFHLVLLEAHCREPGLPRLDPAKIESMGLVLRRLDATGLRQGWLKQGGRLLGWRGLPLPDLDPDPARRIAGAPGQARALATLLAARRGAPTPEEQVLPLFLAPEEVCARLGRTLLHGLVPVASSEQPDAAPPPPDYAALPGEEAAEMRAHLSSYLKARARTVMPRAGASLDPAWRPLDAGPGQVGEAGQLHALGIFLQQLLVELGAFEEGDAPRLLRGLLAGIALPMERDATGRTTRTMPADAWTAAAAPILVAGEVNVSGLAMPLEWPALDGVLGERLTGAALACLARRFAALVPAAGKFANDADRYVVRPFLRARCAAGCPPRLVWSDESEPFRILPWWESDGPAARIALPNITDFRKVKPNVAFEVPPNIANLLQGDMKKLKDGEGSTSGLGIAWICSFSLPIITLCAFIVLSIFLSLFDLIFRWMAFIKICIPAPKRTEGGS